MMELIISTINLPGAPEDPTLDGGSLVLGSVGKQGASTRAINAHK